MWRYSSPQPYDISWHGAVLICFAHRRQENTARHQDTLDNRSEQTWQSTFKWQGACSDSSVLMLCGLLIQVIPHHFLLEIARCWGAVACASRDSNCRWLCPLNCNVSDIDKSHVWRTTVQHHSTTPQHNTTAHYVCLVLKFRFLLARFYWLCNSSLGSLLRVVCP